VDPTEEKLNPVKDPEVKDAGQGEARDHRDRHQTGRRNQMRRRKRFRGRNPRGIVVEDLLDLSLAL